MKETNEAMVKLGEPINLFSEKEVEGIYYYDYYSDIAQNMFIDRAETYHSSVGFFTLTQKKPSEDEFKKTALITTFGVLRGNKIV